MRAMCYSKATKKRLLILSIERNTGMEAPCHTATATKTRFTLSIGNSTTSC